MKDDEADAIVAEVVARLRTRREELGLSINKVAELAGLSHVGVLQIEGGERSPQLRTALKLAAALDLSLAKVLRDLKG